MTWRAPELLWLVPVAWTLAVLGEWVRGRRRDRLLQALGAEGRGRGTRRVRMGLVLAALGLLGVALAGPGWATAPASSGRERVPDVVLLLDVSRSMAARDVSPDRGAVGRMAALRVATGTPARVGVAAFASDAYLLVPPTEDVGLVTLYAESLDPAAVTGQGSDLARALDVSIAALTAQGGEGEREGGVVVLISDGEGFQDAAALDESLDRARAGGVVVHTVLVGTEAGADVPGVLTGGQTQASPQALEAIARATGGMAVDGVDGAAVGRLVASLGRGVPVSDGEGGRPVPVSLLAACAMLLLLAEGILSALRPRGAA